MRESERGFTLVELVVTSAILAILLAGALWMLGVHPGALAQAADDYDAALASARAAAATSGNGATLVFAPRTLGATTLPGFTLRVYAGRPTAANAVAPTTAMPVVSDATVAEAKLGKPPFALFIGASGHVSGKAAYPAIATNGSATFAAIASEPACPSGGFTLTFTSPQGATATRTLPCTTSLRGDAGPANPSPTPNVPIVTPTGLVYHWPADAEQTFVATEWGYTHWFASSSAFACGASVATYPDVLPSPYSPPYTQAEGEATPSPPPDTPFSYPNSGGGSMNDAPALFRLDPSAAGLCTATVHDAFKQTASAAVQVMGWLTAVYGGTSYTHLTAPQLTLPATVLQKAGSSVTLALSKTYDAQALQPSVALDAACSPYVSVSAASGTTPATPSASAAKASLTLTLSTLPASPVACGGAIYDQYPGSQAGEGVPFNATLGQQPLKTWPPGVKYPSPGGSLSNCQPNQPKEFGDAFGAVKPNDIAASPFPQTGDGPYGSDANGCIVFNASQNSDGAVTGAPVDMTKPGGEGVSVLVQEQGYVGDFAAGVNVPSENNCQQADFTVTGQSGTLQSGPTGNFIGAAVGGGAGISSPCYFAIVDNTGTITVGQNTVAVEVASPAPSASPSPSPTPASCINGQPCYAYVSSNLWSTTETGDCGGAELCVLNRTVESYYTSTDGGTDWTAGASCTNSLTYANGDMIGDVVGCPVAVGDRLGPITFSASYTNTGGSDSATFGPITPAWPAGWSPAEPPGTNGITPPELP